MIGFEWALFDFLRAFCDLAISRFPSELRNMIYEYWIVGKLPGKLNSPYSWIYSFKKSRKDIIQRRQWLSELLQFSKSSNWVLDYGVTSSYRLYGFCLTQKRIKMKSRLVHDSQDSQEWGWLLWRRYMPDATSCAPWIERGILYIFEVYRRGLYGRIWYIFETFSWAGSSEGNYRFLRYIVVGFMEEYDILLR